MDTGKVAAGIALLVVGGIGFFGSITGRLPAMLAALFAPGMLTNVKTSQSGNVIQQVVQDLTTSVPGSNPVVQYGTLAATLPVPVLGEYEVYKDFYHRIFG